jgi:hypothetical protein
MIIRSEMMRRRRNMMQFHMSGILSHDLSGISPQSMTPCWQDFQRDILDEINH